jgi:outer membrane protein insertion porin family
MSSIEPAEVVVGADSLDLVIKIFEGKQFTINNVGIRGNERVNDYVIRRELSTYPGDLYSRELIMSTIYRLGSMNHFNPEAIAPDIQPVSNELVDISWNLQEQPSDKVDISGGWGAGMFVGSVGLQLNNLSLKNFFKRGAWKPYPQGQNQQLMIRAQTNGQYYGAVSASFTEPWLGGKKPHSLTVSAYYSAENNANYLWQRATANFDTFGAAIGIGFRLKWPDQYFTLYTELGYQRYMLNNWGSFLMGTGNSNMCTLKTVFGRSSVSQPIYPRSGSEFSLALTLTPPYSLLDGKNYKDPNLSDNDRYKWIEYHKWVLKGRYFQPLGRNQKLVLMVRAEMGYLGHYNPNKLSPFEGFRVGGDGMTGYTLYGEDIIGMRGYQEGALVPMESQRIRDNARVYNKYTVELRYPIILQPRSTIYVLGFLEAGNGFSSWKTFNPFQVKRSAGAGIRIFLPVVGMLGFDWGWGFDPPAGGTRRAGGKVSFTIGQEF